MFLRKQNYHHRGAAIMTQGVSPFLYEDEKQGSGMTDMAGLPLDLM
jgi:hypothetical protein